jgi:hypothetical protein
MISQKFDVSSHVIVIIYIKVLTSLPQLPWEYGTEGVCLNEDSIGTEMTEQTHRNAIIYTRFTKR